MEIDETKILEYFNERAAIMEFDGEIPRKVAERYAEAETIRKFGVNALEAISGAKNLGQCAQKKRSEKAIDAP